MKKITVTKKIVFLLKFSTVAGLLVPFLPITGVLILAAVVPDEEVVDKIINISYWIWIPIMVLCGLFIMIIP